MQTVQKIEKMLEHVEKSSSKKYAHQQLITEVTKKLLKINSKKMS